MQPIDAVFLDAGGVLVSPHPERVVEQLRSGGLEVDATLLIEAHYHGVHALDAASAEPETFGEYHRAYVRHLGLAGDEAERAVELLEVLFVAGGLWNEALPGARAGLEAIAATGVSIVIVSNADGTIEQLLRDSGLVPSGPGPGADVAGIVDSGLVGFAKPDPRIFEVALDLAGTTADRAIHVGDSYGYDVLGARAAGIRPVLVDPFGLRAGADCHRVGGLAEVVALLG